MDERDVFVLADRALNDVVARIRDDQWSMPMPPNFMRRGSDPAPTLREIINYHAYDEAWVPAMLEGKTMDEVGQDAFKGDLLGDEPRANFAALVERAIAAVRGLDDLQRTVHLTYGDYPAREYFWHTTQFRALRAHDIARVISVEPNLPPELVQAVWDQVSPHAEEWRSYGVFPPAVPVPEDAPLLDRLLGTTGRDPRAL
jgi:uncharacterized protein (TIGR03086 family)